MTAAVPAAPQPPPAPCDLKHRPAHGNWGRVPDDQVARLLAGAFAAYLAVPPGGDGG